MIAKIKIFAFIFFVSTFSLPFSAFADTATSTPVIATTTPNTASTTQPTVLGLQTPLIPPLIGQIKEAKAKLSSVVLNHDLAAVYKNVKNKKTGKTEKVVSKYNLTAKDIALAVLDPTTGSVDIVVGMQTGKKMSFQNTSADVTLVRFNGVNSKFQVNSPANGQVIALKYLITGPESGSKKQIESALQEAVYVPYSPDFAQNDILNYGANYLDGIIKKVAADLQQIPSSAVPGETITQAIKPSFIKALVYAEHSDTNQVLKLNDVAGTVNQLNILFALNEGDAYKYSVSTAGARGIAQFMPATYASLVQRHADAALIPDFVAGMSDHENSIKAMYLLLDDYAGDVRVKAAQGFASGRVFDYGAASYNGGTTRVARAVNAFGDSWNEDRSALVNSLQSQVNSLTYQAKSLKKKISAAKDKKTKAPLQGELSAVQSQLASANSQLASTKSATLKNETVNYLQKIYKVIQVFNSNAETLAVN